MDVIKLEGVDFIVFALACLAAVGAIVFVALRGVWRRRSKLLLVALVCLVAYLMRDTLTSMLQWYATWSAIFACPGLVLALVFRQRLKTRWNRYKSWWKSTGTAKALPITFAWLFAVYLIGNGTLLVLPLAVLAFIFRNRLKGWWTSLMSLTRQLFSSLAQRTSAARRVRTPRPPRPRRQTQPSVRRSRRSTP